jgi:hypothetical protein
VPQPHFRPIDFAKTDAEIISDNEEHCRKDPGYKPAEERQEAPVRWGVLTRRIGTRARRISV